MQNPKDYSRKEKFQFLKANKVKATATMRTKELDVLIDQLEAGVDPDEIGPKSIRGQRTPGRRTPLGQFRSKLSIDGYNIPDSKVARWVNDVPGRVQNALEGGYQLVRDPQREVDVGDDPLRTRKVDSAIAVTVGERDGKPLTAYLMVIDKDLYDEDQRDKQKPLNEMDDAIRRGAVEPGEGQYIPKEGIKYEPMK